MAEGYTRRPLKVNNCYFCPGVLAMSPRTNRRELIIQEAERLFLEKGYKATSVRQIAEAVGCKESALYYHFRGGKRDLLDAVLIKVLPEEMQMLDRCKDATSISELIQLFAQDTMLDASDRRIQGVRWIVAEYPNMNEAERQLLREVVLKFHEEAKELVQRFLPDDTLSNDVAWLLIFVSMGYLQFFALMEMNQTADFSWDRLFAMANSFT